MIGYACKYTPLELIEALGGEPLYLNAEAEHFEQAERLCHSNLCCYSKALLQNCKKFGLRELFLVNCCDSLRRCYDALLEDGGLDFLFLMDLPSCKTGCAQALLAEELHRFHDAYAKYRQSTFDARRFRGAFTPPSALPTQPFVGVLGARLPDTLLQTLQKKLPYPVADLSCGGNRRLAFPHGSDDAFDAKAYAAELLAQPACLRMELPRETRAQLSNPRLAGIVYHTVAFCDYYTFEYAQLREKTTLPLLKLETDYLPFAGGQASTRIEAFAETLRRGAPAQKRGKRPMGTHVVGIDSGSTTTNIALLDLEGNLCESATVRTGPKAKLGAHKALEQILAQSGLPREALCYAVATGYGRENIEWADHTVTEISCHARGAHHLFEQVRTIIDIGGQDSKVIRLAENGEVVGFVMNDKCAAGTGRFLEMMARTLELELAQMGERGIRWEKDLTISSVCSVFAESEVISLIADNHAEADIIHGLNKAVAGKTAALCHRVDAHAPYLMTGGVAYNPGVVQALAEKLGEPVKTAENPELCGALGAALYALDQVR
ncbi:acyl-CoA dehydratase activase [Ruminococcaceae bacterium OttesenSCG-928-I18]|nr:acyl-CoA dehydratase activase [Ruminococcaceae bacterium OttesenSCG-928-I18]